MFEINSAENSGKLMPNDDANNEELDAVDLLMNGDQSGAVIVAAGLCKEIAL